MRRLLAIILVCALIAGVGVGCKRAKSTEQVVNLGGIFPMTGGSATYGASDKNGVDMAVEEFNAAGGAMVGGVKTTINYINEDDTAAAEVGGSAAHKLIDSDKVIGIIGPEFSKVCMAVAPICQAAGVPMISNFATNPTVTLVGDYIFRACFIDSFQGAVMANYVYNTLHLKTGAILFDNADDYSKGLAEYFKSSFEKLGGKIIAYVAFTDEATTIDYKAQLTSIEALEEALDRENRKS